MLAWARASPSVILYKLFHSSPYLNRSVWAPDIRSTCTIAGCISSSPKPVFHEFPPIIPLAIQSTISVSGNGETLRHRSIRETTVRAVYCILEGTIGSPTELLTSGCFLNVFGDLIKQKKKKAVFTLTPTNPAGSSFKNATCINHLQLCRSPPAEVTTNWSHLYRAVEKRSQGEFETGKTRESVDSQK